MEFASYDGCGGVDLHFAEAVLGRELGGHVADLRVETGMYVFGVVFVEDFLVDQGSVFGLLRVVPVEVEELDCEKRGEYYGCEDCS